MSLLFKVTLGQTLPSAGPIDISQPPTCLRPHTSFPSGYFILGNMPSFLEEIPRALLTQIVKKMAPRSISCFRQTCSGANTFVQSFQDKIVVPYARLSLVIFANTVVITVENEDGRQVLSGMGISSLAALLHKLSTFSEYCFSTISIRDNSCNQATRQEFAAYMKPFVEYLATTESSFEMTHFAFSDEIRKTGFHAK